MHRTTRIAFAAFCCLILGGKMSFAALPSGLSESDPVAVLYKQAAADLLAATLFLDRLEVEAPATTKPNTTNA